MLRGWATVLAFLAPFEAFGVDATKHHAGVLHAVSFSCQRHRSASLINLPSPSFLLEATATAYALFPTDGDLPSSPGHCGPLTLLCGRPSQCHSPGRETYPVTNLRSFIRWPAFTSTIPSQIWALKVTYGGEIGYQVH